MNSRAKGNGFERLVAKRITKALGAPPKAIYRTPLSGGHPCADRGDLTIAPEWLEHFPFSVECKHNRKWKLERFFVQTAEERRWVAQVCKAAEQCSRTPLLVMRGHHSEIFCAYPLNVDDVVYKPNGPYMVFDCGKETWRLMKFSDFLEDWPARSKTVEYNPTREGKTKHGNMAADKRVHVRSRA